MTAQRRDRGKKPQSTPAKVDQGGVPRPAALVDDLTDHAEQLMLYGVGRTGMRKQLGQYLEEKLAAAEGRLPDPDYRMPVGTVDDYIRRVKDRWEAEPLPDWREAQRRQIRRIEGQIRSLFGSGRHAEIEKRERLLARLQGTEMSSKVEVSGPGGLPLPEPASTVRVVVVAPDSGRVEHDPTKK